MNLEMNQSSTSVDTSSSSTSQSSGQGQNVNVNEQTSNTQTQSTASPSFDPNQFQELQKQVYFATQKLSEMGNVNSELKKQLETSAQQQQLRNQKMAEALGLSQATQEPDLLSKFVENPESVLQELLDKRLDEKVKPLHEEIQARKVNDYIQTELKNKESIKAKLSQQLTPELTDKVMDISSYLSPKSVEIMQALEQNPMITAEQRKNLQYQLDVEIAKSVQENGGYEAIIQRQLGKLLTNNFTDVMQSAAKTMRSRENSIARGSFPASFNNSAGVNSSQSDFSGFANVSSESVYR